MAASLILHENASLIGHNSFGVAASTTVLAEICTIDALPVLFADLNARGLPWLVLGEGSNVLFVGDHAGALVRPLFSGIDVAAEHGDRVRVRVGAGENWHGLVQWCLGRGLFGLENLALIPGSVGAAPVQNIGAYGIEIERHIVAVEAWDRESGRIERLDHTACGFAYRDSRFKREADRWLITAVELELSRRPTPVLHYAGIGEELAQRGITAPSPADVFEAVCALRRRKLPDPRQVGNAGSFFKNPLAPELHAAFLLDHHPDLPHWPGPNGQTKLSAAWLIEQAGFKGYREGDAGVSERHALVLVNHGHATGAQLWRLATQIRNTVESRFGVSLEPEPRIVGLR